MINVKHKKILVTGASGFLGSHIVSGLVRRGVPRENISTPSSRECDLRRQEDCARAVHGREIVFDCAILAGDLMLRSKIPGTIFYENLLMGAQLLDAARQAGVEKLITIGSAVEYSEQAPSPLKESDVWMGLPTEVNLSYGFARKAVLLQGQLYRKQYGFNAVHILSTNIYGPGEKFSSGYLMPSLIQKIVNAKNKGEKFIEAWGTGDPVRDFLYVDDAVEGVLLAAERYDSSEPINLGTGVGISIRELIALISKLVGFDGLVHWDAAKPNGQMHRVMNVARAKELLGFTAKVSLDEGLRRTIQWHKENE